jgi:hypothetical protein
MTYYNGHPADKFAHDECLPANQFETVMLDDFSTGRTDPVTGYRVYDKVPHVHQIWPWHWVPVWGALKLCYVCGGSVS